VFLKTSRDITDTKAKALKLKTTLATVTTTAMGVAAAVATIEALSKAADGGASTTVICTAESSPQHFLKKLNALSFLAHLSSKLHQSKKGLDAIALFKEWEGMSSDANKSLSLDEYTQLEKAPIALSSYKETLLSAVGLLEQFLIPSAFAKFETEEITNLLGIGGGAALNLKIFEKSMKKFTKRMMGDAVNRAILFGSFAALGGTYTGRLGKRLSTLQGQLETTTQALDEAYDDNTYAGLYTGTTPPATPQPTDILPYPELTVFGPTGNNCITGSYQTSLQASSCSCAQTNSCQSHNYRFNFGNFPASVSDYTAQLLDANNHLNAGRYDKLSITAGSLHRSASRILQNKKSLNKSLQEKMGKNFSLENESAKLLSDLRKDMKDSWNKEQASSPLLASLGEPKFDNPKKEEIKTILPKESDILKKNTASGLTEDISLSIGQDEIIPYNEDMGNNDSLGRLDEYALNYPDINKKDKGDLFKIISLHYLKSYDRLLKQRTTDSLMKK
nr:hypothetical protein [Bacteriovoracaceae bacterium]